MSYNIIKINQGSIIKFFKELHKNYFLNFINTLKIEIEGRDLLAINLNVKRFLS